MHAVAALYRERKVARTGLTDADDEGALVLIREQLFRVGASDATVVPVVSLHLDIVAGD